MDFINWCNTNSGFLTAIMSLIGLLLSGVAIWISISVSRKQNKITLFDKRYEIIDAYREIEAIYDTQNALLMVKHSPSTLEKRHTLIVNLDCTVNPIINDAGKYSNAYSRISEICLKIDKNSMLYDKDIMESLEKLSSSFKNVCYQAISGEDDGFENSLNTFREAFSKFRYNHYDDVRKSCKI